MEAKNHSYTLEKGSYHSYLQAGATDNPANLRSIAVQPVWLKILTSLTRDRIYQFLVQNGYTERHIQKGFVPGLSGTFEHTANLSYIINQARLKQRSLTVTLLDLKNAFGEVDHNLIRCLLLYHHVPSEIQLLVGSLYNEFQVIKVTDLLIFVDIISQFVTEYIKVGRGVLQGDCLSPLLFNLMMHTFITYVSRTEYKQLGFRYLKFLRALSH